MFKMHLRARVPNEGARRLAWWLGERGGAGVGRLASAGECDIERIERLLAGELEPGAELAFRISRATGGAVVTRDWRDAAAGGWGDRPAERELRCAA